MLTFYVGPRNQRGRGIGSLFSGLFRTLAPIARPIAKYAKTAFKTFAQSDLAKNLANTALETGKDFAKSMAADLLEGKDIKETAKDQLQKAKTRIASTLRGSGRKRKKKTKMIENNVCKKMKYNLLEDSS